MLKNSLKIFYALLAAWCLIACGEGSSNKNGIDGSKKGSTDTITNTTSIAAINIYIENSGSMNGYVKGNTQFKEAIRDLFVMLKYYYKEENINLYFINSEIHSSGIQSGFAEFASTLNEKTFKVGNTSSSNLNNIFRQILDKTTKDTLAILLSDCIYSIKGNKTEALLSDEKSLTKDAFLSKFKESGNNLSTVIVKLNSTFNGTYYDKNDKPTWLGTDKIKRPYYLTIIGSDGIVVDFNAKIDLSQQKIAGFENKYTLSAQDFSESFFYAAVQTISDIGSWSYTKNTSKGTAIERVRVNDRASQPFTYSIVVDFSNMPLEEEYLTNPKNYSISGDNYKLVAIERYNEKDLKPTGAIFLNKTHKKPTHRLVFQANTKKYTDLTFSLKKQMPEWVEETNTQDDTDIRHIPDKTFGFRYLVAGISEAYETVSKLANKYFEITINIKK